MIIGKLTTILGADVRGLKRGMSQASKSVTTHTEKIKSQVRSTRTSIMSLQKAFVGFAAAAAGAGIAGSFLETAASFEKMGVKLDALTKGMGTETLEEINEWAIKMPVNTKQAVDAFVTMQAMGLQPTIDKMQILADVSSIFGDDVLGRVSLALGQMSTLGRVSAQDLNQLAQAGINARRYLREAFGMTVEEFQKSGKDINEAVEAIWAGMEKEFGGSALRMMNSWSGLVVTFQSAIMEIQRTIMGAGVFEYLKDRLKETNEALFSWLENNRELIKLKVPEYIGKIENAFSKMWEILTYDTDILEWGLVGMLIGGKKGAALLGGIAHLGNVIMTQAQAFKMWTEGQITFGEIASSNYKELKKLVDGVREFEGVLAHSHGAVNRMGDGLVASHTHVSKSADIYESLTKELGAVDSAYQKLIDKEKALEDQRRKARAKIGAQKVNIALYDWFGDVDQYEAATAKIRELTDTAIGKDFWQMKAEERHEVQSRALEAMAEEEEKFSEGIIKLTERTAWSMQENFSNFFFDAMEGRLNSLSDYINAFLDSVKKSMADYLGQMMTESLIGALPKLGTGGGGLLSKIGGFLGIGGGGGNAVMAGGAGHVNFGYNYGGHIGETVRGVGLRSGQSYEFDPNETVIPDRKLGAMMGGGSATVQVIINNNSGEQVESRKSTGPGGIEQLIVDVGANSVMTGGDMAKALETTYNLKRFGRM